MILVYRYRVKSLSGLLNKQARAVNFVWNFSNDTQQSAPFAYSGVRQYERRVSGKCAKFIEQTGIFLNPGCGVDTSYYLDDWKDVKPLCEIVLSDFVDQEDCT